MIQIGVAVQVGEFAWAVSNLPGSSAGGVRLFNVGPSSWSDRGHTHTLAGTRPIGCFVTLQSFGWQSSQDPPRVECHPGITGVEPRLHGGPACLFGD